MAFSPASSAVVIAAWANLLNLLDLRPGRALKTACIVSTPLLATPGRDGEPSRMLAAGTVQLQPGAAADAGQDGERRVGVELVGRVDLGHAVGDEVLIRTARRIRATRLVR